MTARDRVPNRLTAAALFKRASAAPLNGVAYWRCVHALRGLATREVFDEASRLCRDRRPRARKLGCDVLAQLGLSAAPIRLRSVPILMRCARDRNPGTVVSAVCGLGHLRVHRASALIAGLRGHRVAQVRYAVAFALGDLKGTQRTKALIELSSDRDPDVRNWATFGLGSLGDGNTRTIRNALWARVTDRHLETRHEAIVGLARRKDARVIPVLRDALRARHVWLLAVEAAMELADPVVYEDLRALLPWWDDCNLLQEAIEACAPPKDTPYPPTTC